MKHSSKSIRCGFTLLELIVTTAMLAVLTTSCMVVVRTSYTAWNRHEDDHTQRQSGLDVLQHIVRHARQAKAVTSISSSSDNSGSLSLLTINGDILVWDHDGSTNEVRYGVTTATEILATDVEELNFVGLKLDGTTATIESGLIHSVECRTTVNVSRPSGTEAVNTSCQAWLRAW
ncbi:MAG: prepilin-type N-terminal cleavage/methylation domain-containing protein [Planctomycetota bacterium]